MVTPLTLAITPMSVLQNPEFGEAYGKLFEEGEVDDRLLVILFLMVERLRGSCSVWAPYSTMPCKEIYFCILRCKGGIHSFLTCFRYFDVLPTSFGTPLWFTEKEIQEIKGTNLFNATKIQVSIISILNTPITIINMWLKGIKIIL